MNFLILLKIAYIKCKSILTKSIGKIDIHRDPIRNQFEESGRGQFTILNKCFEKMHLILYSRLLCFWTVGKQSILIFLKRKKFQIITVHLFIGCRHYNNFAWIM